MLAFLPLPERDASGAGTNAGLSWFMPLTEREAGAVCAKADLSWFHRLPDTRMPTEPVGLQR